MDLGEKHMPTKEWVIGREHAGLRLDRFLSVKLSAESSRMEIQRLIKEYGAKIQGAITHDGGIKLKEGAKITFDFKRAEELELAPEMSPLSVIHEDTDFLIINKPPGMVVHPGAGRSSGTLVNVLLGAKKKLAISGSALRPGIVHRLDKDTSGILVVAKSARAFKSLSHQLAERKMKKVYRAIVRGRVEHMEGQIIEPLGRHPRYRTKMAVRRDALGKDSETSYKVIERFKQATLIEARPVTGRTHQIRVHLAHIGHPVLGDETYGFKTDHRMMLHAFKLTLEHPRTGKMLEFEAPLPPDFTSTLKALAG